MLKHKDEAKGIDEPLLVIVLTLIPEEEVKAEEKKWAQKGTAHTQNKDTAAPVESKAAADTYVDEDVD